MNRLWYWSASGLLALCAACGYGGHEPETEDGSGDAVSSEGARPDVRSDGGSCADDAPVEDVVAPVDGALDRDSDVSHDGAVSRDSGAGIDGGTLIDGGTHTDVAAPPGDADAPTLTCTAPSADCNHVAADGCEANLSSDAANCGACGHDCGRAACTSGHCAPETLVTGLQVQDITIDANYVYWLNGDPLGGATGTDLRRFPKAGGAASAVVTNIGAGQAPLEYASGYLYFGTITPPMSIVMQRIAVTGGTRTTLADWTANEGAYAVDGVGLYGLDPCFVSSAVCAMGNDSIVHVPATGAAGGGVLVAHRPGARVFGADGTYVYWSDVADSAHATISRIPRGGGTAQVLATNQPDPRIPSLGSDGYVYWVNYCSMSPTTGAIVPGEVMRVRPGMPPERLIADVACGYQVVSDGVDLYWSGYRPSDTHSYVRHMRIGSSTSDVIVDSTAGNGNINLDATHLYYSDYTAIYRVRR